MIDRPEVVFAESDLVFATARTALEASAAGAGVVVCDARGCAGFLTRANAEAWLPYNLGAGILSHPCDAAQLSAAIADWSAAEAVAASALVRERCGLELRLAQLDAIYSEMLAAAPVVDAAAEAAAVGTFIAGWVPNFDQQAPWRRLADTVANPHLGSPIDALNVRLTTVTEKLDIRLTTLTEKVDILSAAVGILTAAVGGAPKTARLPLGLSVWPGIARGLWRRVVPLRLREPLYRLRRRLLAALLRPRE
jgi:hypothetical protein